MTINAPFYFFVRHRTAAFVVFVYWADPTALLTFGLSETALTPPAIAANKPVSPKR